MLPVRTKPENGKYSYIIRYTNEDGDQEYFESTPLYESELSAFDAGINHLSKIEAQQ